MRKKKEKKKLNANEHRIIFSLILINLFTAQTRIKNSRTCLSSLSLACEQSGLKNYSHCQIYAITVILNETKVHVTTVLSFENIDCFYRK